MKNKIAKGLVVGCLITYLGACDPKKEETANAPVVDKEQIKKDIQAREDEFAAIYNSGELKSIGYYADDAITFFQNRAPLIGKEARMQFFYEDLKFNTRKISFTTNEVFPSIDGMQVVEVGHYIVVDSTNKPVNTGNYISLFEKRNDKYVCLRDMSASEIPIK